jgi:drug/metabolite transporter (DMT)-like permease
VNPMVAVLLGWAVYREPVGWREGIGMAVIFVGVWMVKRASVPAGKVGAVEKLSAQRAAESGQYGE